MESLHAWLSPQWWAWTTSLANATGPTLTTMKSSEWDHMVPGSLVQPAWTSGKADLTWINLLDLSEGDVQHFVNHVNILNLELIEKVLWNLPNQKKNNRNYKKKHCLINFQYIDQIIRKITNFKWILCNLGIFSKPKTIVKIKITDKTSYF